MTTQAEAAAEARKTGKAVKFFEGTSARDWSAGTVYECGCVSYTTVLSDGSLGWGGWDERCSEHQWD